MTDTGCGVVWCVQLHPTAQLLTLLSRPGVCAVNGSSLIKLKSITQIYRSRDTSETEDTVTSFYALLILHQSCKFHAICLHTFLIYLI